MCYVCDVLYVCVSCFVVRGCAVSRRYIYVCCCDMFSVVNVFEFLEFAFDAVNVDLQYDEISLTFTAGSVCLCGVCSPWSVCEVVVSVVGAVPVIHVLLFVSHVCMLRECEGARVTAVLLWGPGEVWLR